MLVFYGQDTCTIDGSGRFKLSAAFCRELRRDGNEEVVLFCLPEGGIGVYPPATWDTIRAQMIDPARRAADSLAARRTLRLFCSLAHRTTLSRQGRITIPQQLRDHAGIAPGDTIVQLGAEVGVEIWSRPRWEEEMNRIQEHMLQKGELQMIADLGPTAEVPETDA